MSGAVGGRAETDAVSAFAAEVERRLKARLTVSYMAVRILREAATEWTETPGGSDA